MLWHDEKSASLRCVIYRTSSIGDTVLASACLIALDRLHIRVFVYWLGRKPSLNLLTHAFPSIKAIEIPKDETLNVVDEVFAEGLAVDFIVDLQKNFRSRVVCSLLSRKMGSPVYIWKKRGLERSQLILKARLRSRLRAADPKIKRTPKFQYEYMLDPLYEALKARVDAPELENVKNSNPTPLLPIGTQDAQSSWQKELKFGNWFALAPGAAHSTKQVPLDQMVNVLKEVSAVLSQNKDKPVSLLLLGDEKDRDLCVKILDLISWPAATLNLSGKLSLWESALALKEARLLLSNDSALAHIAEAVGTPVGVMFGPTVEAFGFAPRKKDSRSFSSLLGCRPCSKHGKLPCRYGDQLCFRSVASFEVVNFICERLSQPLEPSIPRES